MFVKTSDSYDYCFFIYNLLNVRQLFIFVILNLNQNFTQLNGIILSSEFMLILHSETYQNANDHN